MKMLSSKDKKKVFFSLMFVLGPTRVPFHSLNICTALRHLILTYKALTLFIFTYEHGRSAGPTHRIYMYYVSRKKCENMN